MLTTSTDESSFSSRPDTYTPKIWDANTGQLLSAPLNDGVTVKFAQFSLDGHRVLTLCHEVDPASRFVRSSYVQVWDLDKGQALTKLNKEGSLIMSAQFSPDGQRVVTAGGNAALVWNTTTGRPLTELKHDGFVTSAQLSPDGQRVLTTSGDHTMRVWDAVTGQPLTEPLKPWPTFDSAEFSPDGQRIVTTSTQFASELDHLTHSTNYA